MRIATIAGIIFIAASTALAADQSGIPQFDPIKGFNLQQCFDEGTISKDACRHAYYCTTKYEQLPKDGECSRLYGINR